MGIRYVSFICFSCLCFSSLAEFSVSKKGGRTMDIVTNTFCAVCNFRQVGSPPQNFELSWRHVIQGGNVLANGTWINVGGNMAVTTGGATADSEVTGGQPYQDPDGGQSCVSSHPINVRRCILIHDPSLTQDAVSRDSTNAP